MNMTRDRVRSIGWIAVFVVALTLLAALTCGVNAVRSQVKLTERKIIAIRQDQLALETEFQTRANQQQLAALNEVEFGFKAPRAAQYVDGERQLAALSRPALPEAPAPIRMASADDVPAAASLAARPVANARAASAAPPMHARPAGADRAPPARFAALLGATRGKAPAPETRLLSHRADKVALGGARLGRAEPRATRAEAPTVEQE